MTVLFVWHLAWHKTKTKRGHDLLNQELLFVQLTTEKNLNWPRVLEDTPHPLLQNLFSQNFLRYWHVLFFQKSITSHRFLYFFTIFALS